jgi:hypothetical protein
MESNKHFVHRRLREYLDRKKNLERQLAENKVLSRPEVLVMEEIITYYNGTIEKYELLLSRIDSSFKVKTH